MQQYRQLTRVPEPERELFEIRELFEAVIQLIRTEEDSEGIDFAVDIQPDSLQVSADPNLLEQVLINLVQNSAQALRGVENARVERSAHIDRRGRSVMHVLDNGPGIAGEAREKIFLPFFTTEKEGSGIGLALSKQILRKHGGSLRLGSEPDDDTTEFVLPF